MALAKHVADLLMVEADQRDHYLFIGGNPQLRRIARSGSNG
jgi:hypothetical protein